MKNILIIGDVFFKLPPIKDISITQMSFLKEECNCFDRFLRAISLKLNLKCSEKYFTINKAAQIAREFDVVILFDGSSNFILSEYISIIETTVDLKRTTLYFYFWNTITKLDDLNISSNWNIVTYDKKDANKYGYRYIGGFYSKSYDSSFLDSYNIDVFFVGLDKGRFENIYSLEKDLLKNNIKTKFIYVSPKKRIFNKKYSSIIPYHKIIEYVKHSKAVLDFTRKGQYGLTLRFYEGIFYNKKVITSNAAIKDYDFYNPLNIMVIDSNTSVDDVTLFLQSTLVPYSPEIVNRYSFASWITRLLDVTFIFDDTIG